MSVVDDFIHDISVDQIDAMERLEVALKAVAAIVCTDRVAMGGALMGTGITMLIQELSLTEEQAHAIVSNYFTGSPNIQAALARKRMHVVSSDDMDPA